MTYNFFPPSNKDSDLLTKQERVVHSQISPVSASNTRHQTPIQEPRNIGGQRLDSPDMVCTFPIWRWERGQTPKSEKRRAPLPPASRLPFARLSICRGICLYVTL